MGRRLAALRISFLLLALFLSLLPAGCADFIAPPDTATPGPSATATPSQTSSPSPTWTSTPTPTATSTPTATPTSVLQGTPFSHPTQPLMEVNLSAASELARWGRGETRDLFLNEMTAELFVATDLGVWVYDAATLTVKQLLAASPASRLAAIGEDGLLAGGSEISQWNLLNGSWQESGVRKPLPDTLLALSAQSNSGPLVLVQPAKQAALIMGTPATSLTSQTNALIGAVFSPTGHLVAGWDAQGSLGVWRVDGQPVFRLSGSPQPVRAALFSMDEQLLAVAYADSRFDHQNSNRVDFLEVASGQLLSSLSMAEPAEGQTQQILSLSWTADQGRFAASFSDGTTRIYLTNERKAASNPPRHILRGRGLPIGLLFSSDGSRLYTGAAEIWDTLDGTLLAAAADHLPPAQDLALSRDGQLAALAGKGGVQLRRVKDGSLAGRLDADGAMVNAVVFSPDGTRAAGACADGLGRIWRVMDGTMLGVSAQPAEPQWSIAWSPNGQYLLTGGENGRIELYDIPWNHINYSIREPYAAVRMDFSPIGLLYGVLTTSGVRIREIGGTLTRQVSGVGLEDLDFSPDGAALAIAGREILQVIDVGSGRDRYAQFDPNRGWPTAVSFSDNGAFLAVGRSNGSIDLLWAGDGEMLRTLIGHVGRVRRLAFTPGAGLLLSLGEDGTVRVWGIPQK